MELLYKRYGLPLYNYAIKAWKLDEDASWDIVYRVLFGIVGKLGDYKFNSEPQFRNMLYTIFNHELINYYHKTKRIEQRLKILSYDDQLSDQSLHSIDNHLTEFWDDPDRRNPLIEILQNLFDELEEWERILLHQRLMGESYKDISQFIDKPENQLKVYYSRVKAKIESQMFQKLKESENE